MAYELYQGALKIGFEGWNPSKDVESATQRVFEFAESPSIPILFSFNDCDIQYLKMEDGQELDFLDLEEQIGVSLRYEKEIVLNIESATQLKQLSDLEKIKRIK